ncbi:adenylyltransferase/cytidyltransferase family protein [Promicromonospora sp. MEB111]|uniref:adenylyltransferase/cytidyltransferase family protein n=1 Tax=Promicromonospora sp. MEB111 TaxID=3040301 RepID=UPI0025518F09|nr:adenylyltransferase/cytidyltransferase family protein [Promicromonospora sp. MEB111]
MTTKLTPLRGFADNDVRAALGRIVMTKGVYDLTHAAHVRSLVSARALGDTLVVGLATDESVRRTKGPTRPILSFAERAEILSALSCVDYVVEDDAGSTARTIRAVRPARVCASHFGWINPADRADLESQGVAFTKLPRPALRSTSEIIASIVNAEGVKL